MGLIYRKAKVCLNYRDEKPQVYKLAQLTYPPIREEDLIKYISNSAAVPVSTVRACVAAITEAIVYFAINGMRVVIPDFGGFYLKVRTKTAKTEEDLTAENIIASTLSYVPVTELRKLIQETGTTVLDGAAYNFDYDPNASGN